MLGILSHFLPIVTYPQEYRNYHRTIKEHHIERAIKKKKFKDENLYLKIIKPLYVRFRTLSGII